MSAVAAGDEERVELAELGVGRALLVELLRGGFEEIGWAVAGGVATVRERVM